MLPPGVELEPSKHEIGHGRTHSTDGHEHSTDWQDARDVQSLAKVANNEHDTNEHNVVDSAYNNER